MAVPLPLPHPKDDPAVRGARLAREALPEVLAVLRTDTNTTPIDRARAINSAWRQAVAEARRHWEDLTTRRTERLGWLENSLPVRPDIPDTATAADRQVLLAAWKTALTEARNADADQRTAMLEEAERYGDDTARRAVLAAAYDDSQWPVIEKWTARHAPEAGAHFTELRDLRETVAGRGFDKLWVTQAFRPIDQPEESKELPELVARHNDEVRRYNAGKAATAPPRRLLELEPGEVPQAALSAGPTAA
ncbi:hypothetical protein FNQ90_07115, partial [Streptomyces alkaliphilus]